MKWHPHVTVAAVVAREGRHLLVEEHTSFGLRINQPAGHWEKGETLLDAVRRETLEESGWRFEPLGLLGVYSWRQVIAESTEEVTFLRFAFTGKLSDKACDARLDEGIERVVWLTAQEISSRPLQLRSPLVMSCANDLALRKPMPLNYLHFQF